ncbi:MAG TPA: beta-ketoacyl synthase N-terminal-like domain-containing protein [Caulobacteraceae bacterium]|nr:beta-ketoacyl synthase N-terminal-like domain-containing protein [Caulobacteraceae bacterium]
MQKVFVAGIGMTRFGPAPQASVGALTAEAVDLCLRDAGAERQDVHAAFFSNAMQGPVEGQLAIAGQIALRRAGIEGVPVVNVENACASGATALWLARERLLSGDAYIVLAVGAEKMVFEDPARQAAVMRAFEGGADVSEPDDIPAELVRLGAGVDGPSGQGRRSRFMDIYAAVCRAHMARFGTTREQLAIVASKNHDHSLHNERCHFRKAMTVEQVLASRPLAYPLTVAMCGPLSDGAAAVLLCTEAGLKRLAGQRPRVTVAACELTSATTRPFEAFDAHVASRAARAAYARAGLGPEDVDVAEVHDATAFGELLMTELMGFCAPGEGGRLAASGATRIGGRIPVNPSGGLESRGHPIGATGLAQICELTLQLRGEAGARQVEGARIALQENSGGLLGVEEAAAVVTLLRGENR